MPKQVRFMIVGGFLGAGKTTALIQVARRLGAAGARVGLITNDQAAGLVDTGLVQLQGMDVEEIAGGCFCCRFHDLVTAADRILQHEPDVLLGEPVGSCTDLSATVIQPLKDLYGDWFRLAPFSVLVDPARVRALLLHTTETSLPEDVAYLFQKQLEEADVILLNKIDLLPPDEVDTLTAELQRRFPETPVFPVSFKDGTGIDPWLEEMRKDRPPGQRLLEIDYERYAHAEAVLGWLNATIVLQGEHPLLPHEVACSVLTEIQQALGERGAEIAHVKLLVSTAEGAVVGNLVALDSEPAVEGDDVGGCEQVILTLNVRVHLAPDELEQVIRACLDRIASSLDAQAGVRSLECFSPAPPKPTHRYDHVVA